MSSTPSSSGSQQRGRDENTSSDSGSELLWALGGVALAGAGVAALLYFSQNDNNNRSPRLPRVTLVEDDRREFVRRQFRTRKITQENCSICLEPLRSEGSTQQQRISMMLRCGHVFHQPCIEGWLRSREQEGQCPNCPACRAPDPTNMLGINIHPYCRNC